MIGKMLGELVIKIVAKINWKVENYMCIGTDSCSMIVPSAFYNRNTKNACLEVRCSCYNHALKTSLDRFTALESNRIECRCIERLDSVFE